MRSASRLLGLLAVLLPAVLAVGRAQARDEDLFIGAADLHTVLFASVDAGRSSFVSAGAKTTPVTSLDRTGPLLQETNGYGVNPERYRADGLDLPALRFTSKASFLGGWQWTFNKVYVAAMAGPEVVHEQLTIDGTVARLSQVRPGLQVQGDIWAEPLPKLVVTGTAVAGSAQRSAWLRVAPGLKIGNSDVIVGPELTSYTTRTYQETRWGGHVTSIPVYMLRMRLSAGMMYTDDRRPATPYLSASVWLRM